MIFCPGPSRARPFAPAGLGRPGSSPGGSSKPRAALRVRRPKPTQAPCGLRNRHVPPVGSALVRRGARRAVRGVSRRGVRCLASIKEKLTWFDLLGDQLVLDRRGAWDRCAGGVALLDVRGGDVGGWDPRLRGGDCRLETLVDLPEGRVASARVDRPMSVADSARIAASRAAFHPLWTALAWCEGTVVVVVGSWAPGLSGFNGPAGGRGAGGRWRCLIVAGTSAISGAQVAG